MAYKPETSRGAREGTRDEGGECSNKWHGLFLGGFVRVPESKNEGGGWEYQKGLDGFQSILLVAGT